MLSSNCLLLVVICHELLKKWKQNLALNFLSVWKGHKLSFVCFSQHWVGMKIDLSLNIQQKKSWRECIFQQLSADTLGFLWQQKDHLSPSAEIPLSYPFPSSAKIPIEGIGKFSFNFPELCICQCCPPMTMRTFWSPPKRHSSGWHEKNAICYLGRAVYCLTIVKKSYDGVFPWRYLKKKQHLWETSLCQHILSKP